MRTRRSARRAGERADRTGELQRIVPTLELETEWALTRGTALPIERFRAVIDEIARTRPGAPGWGALHVAGWASVAGLSVPWDGPVPLPLAAMLRRDWTVGGGARSATSAGRRSRPDALPLRRRTVVERSDRSPVASAPAAAASASRGGWRARDDDPAWTAPSDRSNAAGLTARQLEVLALVVDGLEQRRHRRAARHLDEDRRAPRVRGAEQARRREAPRRRPPRGRARAAGRRAACRQHRTSIGKWGARPIHLPRGRSDDLHETVCSGSPFARAVSWALIIRSRADAQLTGRASDVPSR